MEKVTIEQLYRQVKDVRQGLNVLKKDVRNLSERMEVIERRDNQVKAFAKDKLQNRNKLSMHEIKLYEALLVGNYKTEIKPFDS